MTVSECVQSSLLDATSPTDASHSDVSVVFSSVSLTHAVLSPKLSSNVSIADKHSEIVFDDIDARELYRRRRSTMTNWMSNVSRRLGKRRHIYERL
jgi:hypothetical protein